MSEVKKLHMELLSGIYGGADADLAARVIEEVNSATPATSVSGWSALLPYSVKRVWDKLDVTSKLVAYAWAVEEESSGS